MTVTNTGSEVWLCTDDCLFRAFLLGLDGQAVQFPESLKHKELRDGRLGRCAARLRALLYKMLDKAVTGCVITGQNFTR